MSTASFQLETPPSEFGSALRVRFTWARDRYAQFIELLTPNATVPLLESREGDEAQSWPPSPPLQQCAWHQGPPASVLATGMAGPNHWSLVAAADGPAVLSFDVACRLLVAGEDCRLGNVYRALAAAETSGTPPHILLFPRDEAVACRFCALGDSLSVDLVSAASGPELKLQAAAAAGTLPATIRWQYRLQVTAVPLSHAD